MPDGLPAFGGPAASGAIVQSEYMGRTMKCYPVNESEMESLSAFNADATSFYAAGSACLAFAVGIMTNAAFTNQMTATAEVAVKLGAPVLLVIAIFFALLGRRAGRRRKDVWDRIRQEAFTLQAAASAAAPVADKSAA